MAAERRRHGVVVGVHAVVLRSAGDVAVGRDRETHKVTLIAVPCNIYDLGQDFGRLIMPLRPLQQSPGHAATACKN